MIFRANLVRSSLCRFHYGMKSTMEPRCSMMIMQQQQQQSMQQVQRNFASKSITKTESASSKAGGSSFIPSSFLRGWYNLFGKSSASYLTFLVGLIIVGEYTFNGITNKLWTMNNYGKTFDTADWSVFDELDEEEEEVEEEEEEEEDDDDE